MLSRYSLLICLLVLIAGCTTNPTSESGTVPTPTFTESLSQTPASPTDQPNAPSPIVTDSPLDTPSPSSSPSPTLTVTSTRAPDPEPVQIIYHDYAQVEIITASGTRILIDVANPELLTTPPTPNDILLTTHHHFDHYQEAFVNSFPGQQLNRQAGVINLPEGTITAIPSAHNAGDRLKESGGTNYIFLIELSGLRIVHFGDIGQDQLTAEQLENLLPVDIAITQLVNPFSDMTMDNLKGFRLMEQVNPRLIIPTHVNRQAIQYALGIWSGFYSLQSPLIVMAQSLSDETQFLLLGPHAEEFSDLSGLNQWNSQD